MSAVAEVVRQAIRRRDAMAAWQEAYAALEGRPVTPEVQALLQEVEDASEALNAAVGELDGAQGADGHSSDLAEDVAARVVGKLCGLPPDMLRGFLTGGTYLAVRWRDTPGDRKGATVENVLDLALRRLADYQQGALRCEENALAFRLLLLAKDALLTRTRHRQAQGVKGTDKPHDLPQEWRERVRELAEVLGRTTLTDLVLPKAGGG